MKKILILLVIGLFVVSCRPSMKKNSDGVFNSTNTVNKHNIVNNHDVIVIDGCEYIVYSESQGYGGYGFMAHKGNCKNSVHKNR